jgi:Uma2 family endonuclease
MAIPFPRRPLTVEMYHALAEKGLLGEGDRVELINGDLVPMSPLGSPHSACVRRLDKQLHRLRLAEVQISIQNPVQLNEQSEPEPDVAILKHREDFYEAAHPRPQDVLLLIEVADSSLEKDRSIKLEGYAQAGIAEYWIINLVDRQIEIYTQPQDQVYKSRELRLPGDTVMVLGETLMVEDVLGRV